MRSSVVHFVAHARGSYRGLCEHSVAAWTWSHLRRAFPAALACCLMPDHVHLVAPAQDPALARGRVARVLGHVGRNFAMPGFGPVEVTSVHNAGILARTVRYVVRNACADGLVADPLEWPWTTHRDVIGGIAAPWVTPDRLAAALDVSDRDFIAAHQRYVSRGDTTPNGTPLPVAARHAVIPRYAPPDLARAAASALRTTPRDIQTRGPTRSLFVHLAAAAGWRDHRALALATQTSRSTIWRIATAAPPPLAAALTALGDPRLLQCFATPRRIRAA